MVLASIPSPKTGEGTMRGVLFLLVWRWWGTCIAAGVFWRRGTVILRRRGAAIIWRGRLLLGIWRRIGIV